MSTNSNLLPGIGVSSNSSHALKNYEKSHEAQINQTNHALNPTTLSSHLKNLSLSQSYNLRDPIYANTNQDSSISSINAPPPPYEAYHNKIGTNGSNSLSNYNSICSSRSSPSPHLYSGSVSLRQFINNTDTGPIYENLDNLKNNAESGSSLYEVLQNNSSNFGSGVDNYVYSPLEGSVHSGQVGRSVVLSSANAASLLNKACPQVPMKRYPESTEVKKCKEVAKSVVVVPTRTHLYADAPPQQSSNYRTSPSPYAITNVLHNESKNVFSRNEKSNSSSSVGNKSKIMDKNSTPPQMTPPPSSSANSMSNSNTPNATITPSLLLNRGNLSKMNPRKLLPSMTLHKPTGPTEAERKIEELTRQLEEEMAQQEEQEAYFGICYGCDSKVIGGGSACMAMGNLYHTTCFTCVSCGQTLRGKGFYNVGGKVFCEEDYLYSGFQQTVQKCTICSHLIMETILQAMGKPYHPGCFRCCVCNQCLDGFPFTVDMDDKIYCISHYHEIFAPICARCSKSITPIEGTQETVRVVSMDKDFHVDCYSCEDCGIQLTDEPDKRCYPLDNHLLCKPCHVNQLRIQSLSFSQSFEGVSAAYHYLG